MGVEIAKQITMPKISFTIGISGKREISLEDQEKFRAIIAKYLTQIAATLSEKSEILETLVSKNHQNDLAFELRLLSPLAAGADQILFDAAGDEWQTQAIIPYKANEYVARLGIGIDENLAQLAKSRFQSQLSQANKVLEIDDNLFDENPAHPVEIQDYLIKRRYRTIGQLMVRNCDLMFAIWDGKPENGIGGTAEVLQEAYRNSVPIIWINSNNGETFGIHSKLLSHSENILEVVQFLINSKEDNDQVKNSVENAIRMAILSILPPQESKAANHEGHSSSLLSPKIPMDSLRTFVNGNDHTRYFEKAYSSIGLKYLIHDKFQKLIVGRGNVAPKEFWSKLNEKTIKIDYESQNWDKSKQKHNDFRDEIDTQFGAYPIQIDAIATRLGHAYRSAYIVVFLLIAAAVGLGLLPGLFLTFWEVFIERFHREANPISVEIVFVSAEVLFLLAIAIIYIFATHQQWHRRWLNSRFISEKFRGLRILSWLGFAGRRQTRLDEKWPSFFINACAALPNLPSKVLGENAVLNDETLLKILGDKEKSQEKSKHKTLSILEIVESQIGYHQNNFKKLETFQEKLEFISKFFAIAAMIMASLFVFSWVLPFENHDFHKGREIFGKIVAFVDGVFPAIAASLLSIRFQGDYHRFAKLSEETSQLLELLKTQIIDIIKTHKDNNDKTAKFPLYEEVLEIAFKAQEIFEDDVDTWQFVYVARPTPGL